MNLYVTRNDTTLFHRKIFLDLVTGFEIDPENRCSSRALVFEKGHLRDCGRVPEQKMLFPVDMLFLVCNGQIGSCVHF